MSNMPTIPIVDLSPDEVIRLITTTENITLKQFEDYVSRIDPGALADQQAVFYSRNFVDGVKGSEAADQLANQSPNLGVINESNFDDVLNNEKVWGVYADLKSEELGQYVAPEKIYDFGYADPSDSPWAEASRKLASIAEGDVIDKILEDYAANTLTLETFNDYNNLWR